MPKVEIREDDLNFDLNIPNFPKEIFADGLGQMLSSETISKVTLFSTDGIGENGIEQRNEVIRIVMTNNALKKMAEIIIENLGDTKSD